VLLAIPAFAQGKWWQSEKFTRELGLTQEQSRRLEEIFQAALPTLREKNKALAKAEIELEALIERGGDQEVMEHLNHVENARAELNKSRTLMLLRMRKVLTSDQWAKFTALHQASERERAQHNNGAKAK
jgi:Spy/CpxP family protein refolding chaperone